ncbi:hypothetical protein ACROYT_G006854 [Oculina patagonica]
MVDSSQRNFSNVTSSAPAPTPQYEDYDIDSVTLKWLRIVFYGVICIVGTVGNALVILAYRNPRMRSVTNLFIANLGVADLTVTLINVPITVTYSALDFWPFGAFLCKAFPYILGITVFSSVGTLIAIAADRYRAIVHPLLPRIRTRHAIMIIAAIWIVALIYPTPLLIYQKLTEDEMCSEEWPSDQARKIYTVILFVALYLIPLIAISVLYFLICHNLNTSESSAQEGSRRARKSVIRMLVIVVVLFSVCWLPYHIVVLYDNFDDSPERSETFFQFLMLSFWLSFANSCCNPVVYAVLNRNYRREFGRLLRCQSLSSHRNAESLHGRDRRFSSAETKSTYRKTSKQQLSRIFLKSKSNANEDFTMTNGAMAEMSNASRSGQGNSSSGSSHNARDEKLLKKQRNKSKKKSPVLV